MSVLIDFFATKANLHYVPHRTIERNLKFRQADYKISRKMSTFGAADRDMYDYTRYEYNMLFLSREDLYLE